MHLELLPALAELRALYHAPRDPARFRGYLRLLTGGGDDLALPITAMNPMGKAHLAAYCDALAALDAERVVAAQLAELADDAPGRLRVALAVADDVAGGWTNRYTTDAQHRFECAPLLARQLGVVLLFASEPPSAARVQEETRAVVLRAAYQHEHGAPRTLAEHLAQERHVLRAGAVSFPPAPSEGLAATRACVDARAGAIDAPTMIYACLYGDDAARQLGYAPLGLPPWAGLALARAAP